MGRALRLFITNLGGGAPGVNIMAVIGANANYSFMFAENNFYTTNLDTTKASGGTQKIEIYGNMTAGNHVKMPRNQTAGYVPLNVTFDTLIQAGGGPPDLPKPLATSDGK